MFSKVPIADYGEIARRRREGFGSAVRRGAAILLLAGTAGPAAAAAPTAAADAASVASAFRDICLRTRFDRGLTQAALERLGWAVAGSGRTDSGKGYELTRWKFPLGEVLAGYNTIGGIELRTFSCSLVVKGAVAPPRAELEAALEAVLSPTRFRDSPKPLGDFTRVARIKDRGDEQELVMFAGNQAPMHVAPRTIGLRPGFLIGYSYTKGVHAKELRGH